MKANLFRLTNIVSLGSAIDVQSLAPGLPLGLCKLNSVRPIHKQPDNKPNPRSLKLAKTMALFTFFYMLVLKFFQLIPSAPGLPLCNSPPSPDSLSHLASSNSVSLDTILFWVSDSKHHLLGWWEEILLSLVQGQKGPGQPSLSTQLPSPLREGNWKKGRHPNSHYSLVTPGWNEGAMGRKNSSHRIESRTT